MSLLSSVGRRLPYSDTAFHILQLNRNSHILSQQFGEMQRLCAIPISAEVAGDLHQATGVVGDDVLSTGARDGFRLIFCHGGGDLREFDREGSAETTATFRILHLD